MAFRFKQTSCVVAGTFNIYVVQPSLLAELGIIPEGESPCQIMVNLKHPSLKFTAEPLPGITWSVSAEQMTAEADRADSECGDLISRVLQAIRYTPLRGIGTNLILTADADDAAALTDRLFYDPQPIPGSEITQRTTHTAVKRGNNVFNSQAAITDTGIELSLNVHTELSSIPRLPDVNDAAVAAAQDFRNRIAEAVQIAETLYGIEIDHAANAHI